MSPTSLSRPVFWFAAAAFIFFGGYFSWTALHTRTFSGSSLIDVEREFSAIQPPSNARRSGDVRRSSKITVQAVYANYVAPMSDEEIARHYRAQLTANGWKQAGSDGRINRFCKADIDATLEFVEATSDGNRYYFGITREDVPARKTGC